ncbi:MAG: hypothetical protein IKY18_01940 [Oscillospiraceae bacterium]|nr:hypothetical protein [Oscillospiraceae bacterium]
MEKKLFNPATITIDGCMDEAAWASVPEQTGLYLLYTRTPKLAPAQTSFKILPCEDRIIVGIRCEEPDMAYVDHVGKLNSIWESDAVELYLSPSNSYFDFYQFVVCPSGATVSLFYSEGGIIQPDPYSPEWKSAVYKGEDFWSVEIEIPLVAFYMTPNELWSDNWLVNVCRTRYSKAGRQCSSWSPVENYMDCEKFRSLPGFPMRPKCDDLRIATAIADINDENEMGFTGTLTVKTMNPEDGEFEFSSDCSDEVLRVSLKAGGNEFTVPCAFPAHGLHRPGMQLKRLSDGKIFYRRYPVRVTYEALKFTFTQPEYRTNFYPGQDYSKIAGKIFANQPVTLKLEGPGIETTTITPAADGSFCFDTPNFEIGDAFLTATTEDRALTKKIRRLAPSDHMMTWISGGNLIVNGKPVLRRNMYAEYYRNSEAFKRRYDADDKLCITREICMQTVHLTPFRLIRGCDSPGGEATKDARPSDEMFEKYEAIIDANRGNDFAFYYIDDEPECRGVSPIYLKHLYDFIGEKDPYHVVLTASRAADIYLDAADWFEAHPYINPYTNEEGRRVYTRKINSLGYDIDKISKLNRSDKCIGFMPTCFGAKKEKPGYYPTFEEYICQTWAPMIRGGKTLWPYAYHDMNDRGWFYEGTRYLFSSFEALEDLVLFGKRTHLIKTPQVESVLYETEKEKMFVLVNMEQDPQTVTLEGISGTWYNFRHGGTITGNTFELKPHEVVIGTSEIKDEGLPTYQEVEALVQKLEYERTHTGNLIFERRFDIGVTGSFTADFRKLVDGVKDNLGGSVHKTEKPKFLEMNLTKVKPTFTKVVVHGFQIDDMSIQVKNGEELTTPAIAEEKIEEFSKTFILAEPISPEVLRLNFGLRRLELYEIELF